MDWGHVPRTRELPADPAQARAAIRAAGDAPAVFRGLVAHWPAAQAGAQSDAAALAYLRALAPHASREVEIFVSPPGGRGWIGFTPDLAGVNFHKRRETLLSLLGRLEAHAPDADPPVIYAGAIPLRETLPAFLAENRNPLAQEPEPQLVSLWLGAGCRVPAHWDVPQNLICVVSGRRRYILFPPEQVANLYSGPLDRTLAGQPSSLVDFDAPDFARHPRFAEAVAAAQVAELGPGDALYLPSMWWHQASSFGPIGAMMNIWWREGPQPLASPLSTLVHGLSTLRDLPAAERAAWHAFFAFYLFEDPQAATAHLPESALGVHGPRSEAQLRRIADIVARSLLR